MSGSQFYIRVAVPYGVRRAISIRALADHDQAVPLQPESALLYLNRAVAWMSRVLPATWDWRSSWGLRARHRRENCISIDDLHRFHDISGQSGLAQSPTRRLRLSESALRGSLDEHLSW